MNIAEDGQHTLTAFHSHVINSSTFIFQFPLHIEYVQQHLVECFRHYFLNALEVPIYDREKRFNAYIGEKLWWYCTAERVMQHEGLSDYIAGKIRCLL